MRTFEIILVGTAFLTLLQAAFLADRKPGLASLLLPIALILVFVLHVGLEKMRWQMAPIYCVVVFATIWVLIPSAFPKLSNDVSKPGCMKELAGDLAASLSFLLLVIGLLLSIVAPIFQIPAPGGPYPIGTQDIHLSDSTRSEPFAADPNNARELMVRVWYPAQPVDTNATPQPYWPGVERIGPLLLKQMDLPTFLLDYMALVPSHSYLDAPLAIDSPKYPVLIFSHGYTDDISGQLTLMEELASHGYIVFSISHTYEALATEFPDGRIVLAAPRVFSSPLRPRPREVNLDDRLSTWVEDTIFVLDTLEGFNAGSGKSLLAGHLDMKKIGVFGYSFGGATATEVCLKDNRCQAGANIDGSQFGHTDFENQPLKTPFMFFYNQDSEGMNDFIYERVENWAYRVAVAGTTHFNFSDKVLWSPFLKYADKYLPYGCGPIPAQLITEIKRAYILAFFDRHLKSARTPLLDGPSPDYPGVHFQFRNPRQ